MDKIGKILRTLALKEQEIIKQILIDIQKNNIQNLDVKKLKGFENIFRIRKSNIRIIYKKDDNKIFILKIEKRNENIYKF